MQPASAQGPAMGATGSLAAARASDRTSGGSTWGVRNSGGGRPLLGQGGSGTRRTAAHSGEQGQGLAFPQSLLKSGRVVAVTPSSLVTVRFPGLASHVAVPTVGGPDAVEAGRDVGVGPWPLHRAGPNRRAAGGSVRGNAPVSPHSHPHVAGTPRSRTSKYYRGSTTRTINLPGRVLSGAPPPQRPWGQSSSVPWPPATGPANPCP